MSDLSAGPEHPQATTDAPTPDVENKIPLFGARKRARELSLEVDRLRAEQLRLGLLSVVELEHRREELQREIDQIRARAAAERAEATAALARETAAAAAQRDDVAAELASLQASVVVTEETALLQEAGVYEYRHPLSDSVAYQSELKRLRDDIKLMTKKDGGAVQATTAWTVNGSAAQGRAMVRDFSKLLLRAYNAEADNLVRGLKPYKLASAKERLTKVTATIAKLGKTMDIRISSDYHRLRIRELELTADYLEKLAEEKEREREERERLRLCALVRLRPTIIRAACTAPAENENRAVSAHERRAVHR